MSTNATIGNESIGTDLEARDVRTLTEHMSVLGRLGRVKGATDLYLVVSESESEYLVDARAGVCECPDHRHRDIRCKHLRAVAFATGARPIPEWVDREAINNTLGNHVDADPVFGGEDEIEDVEPAADGVAAKPARGVQVATDGGQLLNDETEPEPEITRHVEPPAQGGAAYLRCEGCGREVIGTDESRLWHREECSHSEDR